VLAELRFKGLLGGMAVSACLRIHANNSKVFITMPQLCLISFSQAQKNSSDGCLALCLLLDQFPRNMFRGSAKAYATDSKALVIAKYAISKGFDQVLIPIKRRFLYLPFEHSENLNDQRRCVELFETMKKYDPMGHDYALRHLKTIERFGRFPHRNIILNRMDTPEEQEYLALHPAGF
jgi:uncharacterized protein (DUF924 family)